MRRCVIVGGAAIGNYETVRGYFRADDFFIYCDSGLSHQERLGRAADLIVGDFDSHEKPHTETETIVLPCEKDDTDTVYAVKEALNRGFEEFLLIGAAGGRLDHTLGNLSILVKLFSLGKHGLLVDDYSEMEIVGKEPVKIADSFPFFSLLNLTGRAENITIRDAKYPLANARITCDYQYGVSNEPLPGRTATVTVGDGELLLIRVR